MGKKENLLIEIEGVEEIVAVIESFDGEEPVHSSTTTWWGIGSSTDIDKLEKKASSFGWMFLITELFVQLRSD